jgi:hypothetical protein
MLSRAVTYISHHAIAILALVCSLLALAGASYAAIAIPKNSVGTAQLKQGAVTPSKLSGKQFGGYVRMWAHVGANGKLAGSYPQAHLVRWTLTPGGLDGGFIEWKQRIPKSCFTLATAESFPEYDYASTQTRTTPGTGFGTQVAVTLSGPVGVLVTVIC